MIWTGMSGVFASQNAFACSPQPNSSHCYAIMEVPDIPNNSAILDTITIQCLYYPNATEFADNEEWETNGTYWVEAGVLSGEDYFGNYHDKDWFWADNRPNGGGFSQHWPTGLSPAATDTEYNIEIQYIGNDAWDVYGADSDIYLGQSTANPLEAGRVMQAGTEYTANSGSGIRDEGIASNLQYADAAGGLHDAGPNGGFDDSSSNNWISEDWSSSSSQMEWSTC
jgi:hypothetical protein